MHITVEIPSQLSLNWPILHGHYGLELVLQRSIRTFGKVCHAEQYCIITAFMKTAKQTSLRCTLNQCCTAIFRQHTVVGGGFKAAAHEG